MLELWGDSQRREMTSREALETVSHDRTRLTEALLSFLFISLLMKEKVISILKALWQDFTAKRVMDAVGTLTYSTLLAIVPILAVVFAIARGFGYSKYIESWFRETLASQPQAAEAIIGFVNSYLVHTKSGLFLGIGLLFMLWTVLILTRNIEQTFNDIWQVKKPRSIVRTLTDYIAMFFLVPIVIVVTSGLSLVMATLGGEVGDYFVLGPVMRIVVFLMPYVLMSAVFVILYVFMPNTKVKFKSALLPGIVAGVAMQLLQLFYIHSQLWVSGYNAIYGSFAALPLFMLWVQASWTICLMGAELTYTNQNLEDFAFNADASKLSHRARVMMSVLLMSLICKRFAEGRRPYTALELKMETGIPIRIVSDLLYDLVQVKLLSETRYDENDDDCRCFQPAESINHLSVGTVVDRLESKGIWSMHLDLHHEIGTKVNWPAVYLRRKMYLNDLDKFLLKDL